MTRFLRRTLLVSTTALAALTLIPAIASLAPSTIASFVVSQAEARGGDDDGGSDDDGGGDDNGGGGGGRDDSGRDDSGRDDSGRDSSDDDDDDSSGRDRDRDRDRNRSGDDDDDDYGDSDDRYDDSADDGSRRSGNRDRDEIRLIVNNTQLQGLLSGSMIPVDQNGKRLRFEVEQEHGNTEIKLRAPRGTLSGVTVVPAI